MLKKEEQAISIISFLVLNWRDARGHGGDYKPIMQTLSGYLDDLKEEGKMSDKELDILYLKGKIKADEEQLQSHKEQLEELLCEDKVTSIYGDEKQSWKKQFI